MASISHPMTTVRTKKPTVGIELRTTCIRLLQLVSHLLHKTKQRHIFVVFGLRNLTKKKQAARRCFLPCRHAASTAPPKTEPFRGAVQK